MMMETGLFVRKAQQIDIPAILEIEWECFREDSFSKEQFAYLISRSKGTFYVMMEGDRVIAYVSLLFHGGTHYLRIYSIAVHPDFRGKGLGQALMDQTIRTQACGRAFPYPRCTLLRHIRPLRCRIP